MPPKKPVETNYSLSEKQNVIMNKTKKPLLIAAGVFLLALFSPSFVENNEAGYMQVKQDAWNGNLTLRTTPGIYSQMFSTITTYKMFDTFDFDKIKVKFNDGSTALITGAAQFSLPTNIEDAIKLHIAFGGENAVREKLIKRVILAALMQSANLFRAEDIYSKNRSALPDLVTDQIREGIYATDWSDEWIKDPESDKESLIRRVEVKRDANKKPIVNEVSAFKLYNVELVGQVTITDIDFDEVTDGLIAKRKEAEQNQVVARANAERAKQDAITAMEEGKRDIAKAEAVALVESKKATVEAEKNTKVAMQKALQAEEEKKAVISRGEAEAAATKLKVAAGLSPYEKAMIDKETAIGVAGAIAGVKFPRIMVIGGGDKEGSKVSPFDAIGIQALMQINKELSKGEK